MLLEQSPQARHDVSAIRPYVISHSRTGGEYGRNLHRAQLCAIPLEDSYGDWTNKRVGRALVDLVDGGWSPFGGYATLKDAGNLIFDVAVYND